MYMSVAVHENSFVNESFLFQFDVVHFPINPELPLASEPGGMGKASFLVIRGLRRTEAT